MVQIFLSHLDAAGAETRVELERYSNDISTFYLPNDLPTNLTVENVQTTTHTYTRLDVFGENVALIKYNCPNEMITLLTGEFELQVPSSTNAVQRSFLLRPDDQFLTSSGRWQINWDHPDETSHSMRPPSLLPDTSTSGEHIEEIVIKSISEAVVDEENITQDSGAEKGQSTSIEPAVLLKLPENSDQEAAEHEASSLPTPPVRDDRDLRNARPNVPALKIDLATDEAVAMEQRRTIEVQRDNTTHTQPGSIRSDVADVRETIRHADSDLVTSMLRETAGDHAETDHTPSVEGAGSDAIASASDENQMTPKKTLRRKKRSLLEIEADFQGPPKKPRTHTLEFESTDEDDDTVVLVPRIDVPAPTKAKKKKTASRSKAKSTVKIAKSKRRSSTSQAVQDDQACLDAATPPPRSSTRLASTPSSRPESPVAKSSFGKSHTPILVFSSGSEIQHDKKIMNSFQKLGGIVTDKISQANTLCIGGGSLRKTAKLVIAVATGKDIVTDRWLLEAHMQQKLPDPRGFVPQDPEHEKEWSFKLVEAIERGRQGLNLLRGYDVYLTHRIQVDLGNLKTEVKQVAMTLGANKVGYGVPARRSPGKDILIIGSLSLDEQSGKVSKLKAKMYTKDLLLLGALRGLLELDSEEFMIETPVKEEV